MNYQRAVRSDVTDTEDVFSTTFDASTVPQVHRLKIDEIWGVVSFSEQSISEGANR
jgi:hypothetical protein